MELLTQKTLPQSTRRIDDQLWLSISRKNGTITVLKGMASYLKLGIFDKIGLVSDADQLYLVPHHPDGYQLRTNKSLRRDGYKNLLFTHALLVTRIYTGLPEKFRAAHAHHMTFRVRVSPDSTQLPDPEGAGTLDAYLVIGSSATFTSRSKP